ncbi:hypothetical protein QQ045_019297 [Rhodiola kirilowii]
MATADQSNDAAFVEDGGGVRCSDSSPSLSYHIRHGSDLVERVSDLTVPLRRQWTKGEASGFVEQSELW